MNKTKVKDKIIALIIKDKLDQALDEFEIWGSDKSFSETSILLKAQLKAIKNQEFQGVITNEEANVAKNKIRKNLLALINKTPSPDKKIITSNVNEPKSKYAYLILFFVLIMSSYFMYENYRVKENIKPDFSEATAKDTSATLITAPKSNTEAVKKPPTREETIQETLPEKEIMSGIFRQELNYELIPKIIKNNTFKGFPIYHYLLSTNNKKFIGFKHLTLDILDATFVDLQFNPNEFSDKLIQLRGINNIQLPLTKGSYKIPLSQGVEIKNGINEVLKLRFFVQKDDVVIPPSKIAQFVINLTLTDKNDRTYILLKEVNL